VQPDVVAPDGSEVRLLVTASRGSCAHFELAEGETSVAVRHRTVEEIWYFVAGRGVMWRRDDAREAVIDVEAGTAITIPCGTHFQHAPGMTVEMTGREHALFELLVRNAGAVVSRETLLRQVWQTSEDAVLTGP
jgi:mannose-6-phosphate isomerase-like protein (cupin superfamily)